MDSIARARRSLAALLLLLAIPAAGLSATEDTATARLGIKVLPFTGITVPHQQIADFDPAPPLGLGLEVYFRSAFSLSVDVNVSWHSGGPTSGSDLKLSSLQLLGRWHWPRGRWTPFAQVGFGGYMADLDEGRGSDQYGGVGFVFGGGVETPVWRDLYLQADLRSNWVNTERSSDRREIWSGHTQLLLWFVYKLP